MNGCHARIKRSSATSANYRRVALENWMSLAALPRRALSEITLLRIVIALYRFV
jgi:hypothetical protein